MKNIKSWIGVLVSVFVLVAMVGVAYAGSTWQAVESAAIQKRNSATSVTKVAPNISADIGKIMLLRGKDIKKLEIYLKLNKVSPEMTQGDKFLYALMYYAGEPENNIVNAMQNGTGAQSILAKPSPQTKLSPKKMARSNVFLWLYEKRTREGNMKGWDAIQFQLQLKKGVYPPNITNMLSNMTAGYTVNELFETASFFNYEDMLKADILEKVLGKKIPVEVIEGENEPWKPSFFAATLAALISGVSGGGGTPALGPQYGSGELDLPVPICINTRGAINDGVVKASNEGDPKPIDSSKVGLSPDDHPYGHKKQEFALKQSIGGTPPGYGYCGLPIDPSKLGGYAGDVTPPEHEWKSESGTQYSMDVTKNEDGSFKVEFSSKAEGAKEGAESVHDNLTEEQAWAYSEMANAASSIGNGGDMTVDEGGVVTVTTTTQSGDKLGFVCKTSEIQKAVNGVVDLNIVSTTNGKVDEKVPAGSGSMYSDSTTGCNRGIIECMTGGGVSGVGAPGGMCDKGNKGFVMLFDDESRARCNSGTNPDINPAELPGYGFSDPSPETKEAMAILQGDKGAERMMQKRIDRSKSPEQMRRMQGGAK